MPDQETYLRFRAALKAAMDRKGLKQYQVADAVGVVTTTVGGWLSRGSIPYGSTLVKLATVLGLEPEDLVGGSGRELRGQAGKRYSERASVVREVLDELDVLLRDLRKRWETQDGRGKAAEEHYQALESVRKGTRTRRSKGS